jgi:hypothetical protein
MKDIEIAEGRCLAPEGIDFEAKVCKKNIPEKFPGKLFCFQQYNRLNTQKVACEEMIMPRAQTTPKSR